VRSPSSVETLLGASSTSFDIATLPIISRAGAREGSLFGLPPFATRDTTPGEKFIE
jgi:hypothetical protein